jgi:hypothetical protein
MKKFEFFNQCDRWRIQFNNGEKNWHIMMAGKESISMNVFEKMVNDQNILDEDETLSDFISYDQDSGFYKSVIDGGVVFFIQTAGFEFIFTPDGNEPCGLNPSSNFNLEYSVQVDY